MTDLFVLQPLEIAGHRIELSLPYTAPASEIFTAIVARQDIEDSPAEAIKFGPIHCFEDLRKQLQQVYLFGGPEPQDMMLSVVDTYLQRYPDEQVSGYVDFARKNRPRVNVEGFSLGGSKQTQALRDKKRKEKLKQKSRRINRR